MPTTKTKSQTSLDLSKERARYFRAPIIPEVIELGPVSYLAIVGQGAPEGDAFQAAVGALYSMAYTLKMTSKKAGQDFKVAPLEGQWWVDEADAGGAGDVWTMERSVWRWKALIMVPDFVTEDAVAAARAAVVARRGETAVLEVRLESLSEGLCVQAMHVGPFATEAETIEKMRAVMEEERLEPSGPHHEVYLGDPRRAKPERLRTILRQPVRRSLR